MPALANRIGKQASVQRMKGRQSVGNPNKGKTVNFSEEHEVISENNRDDDAKSRFVKVSNKEMV